MSSDHQYNPFTGRPVSAGGADGVPAAAVLGLEPPRFCVECGRRMVVQVLPNGWMSDCSRHGRVDSAALGRR